MGGGDVERVRRAVAVELEHPPPELSAVEEPYRKIVEEVATYVAERGRLEKFFYQSPNGVLRLRGRWLSVRPFEVGVCF